MTANAIAISGQPSFIGIVFFGIVLPVLSIGCQQDKPSTAPAESTVSATEDATARKEGPSENSYEERFRRAVVKLEEGQVEESWQLAKQLVISRPKDPELIFLTARIMAARKDLRGAIQQLDQIPRESPQWGPAAGQAAEWLVSQGDLAEAEKKLLSVIKEYPSAVPAFRLLARIYNAQGRRWEASRLLDRLIRLGDFTTSELMSTIDFRESFADEATFKAFEGKNPNDPYVKFSTIRSKLLYNNYGMYVDELRALSSANPELREPWVWTGTTLMELERWDELVEWFRKPVKGAEKHPEYWYALGGLMLQTKRFPEAARCFSESIRLDRHHVAAHQGLADALLEMNQVDDAQRVRRFASDLISINEYAQQISYKHGDPKLYGVIADLYASMGDEVSSFGWSATASALGHRPMSEELQEKQQSLRKGLTRPTKTLDGLDVDSWPLPESLSLGGGELPDAQFAETPPRDDTANRILMEDVAARLGINAQYHNGAKTNRGWSTLEGIGGGVNVLDYDMDGWPDLIFSEAGDSPAELNPVYERKQTYRSNSGLAFHDVSQKSCLADVGYGQGMGVCDIDQDGFPDVLIANLGESRIYRNSGDGTFEYLVIPQKDADSIWNSSINAADLNGDGLPDIVAGSYIHGKEAITRWCEIKNSKRRSCSPKIFSPGKNRILFSEGDWNWTIADEDWLESIQRGYTLGTLLTNLDGTNGNDVFFANDVSPNALLLSQRDPATDRISLVESAATAGVAADSVGRAQACMGIACGDQNRDGTLDLIVTNFYNEVSTLYLQSRPGIFVDGTRRSKLGIATLHQLSFGCQLVDLDDDGWLDFIAVNGHIEDRRDESVPWHMPTQVLKNDRGQFRWLNEPSPGSYFDGNWIGRGLQMLDYDRDGKLDLVATHLDRPAALLQNQTQSPNRFLQVQLTGTRSDRDATGAIVRITCDQESWVAGMHTGEGFYGSNERLIHFGVGNHSTVDLLRIEWPGGLVEEFHDLKTNQRIHAIEGVGIHPVAVASNG